ncbi:MAG: ATP-binding protein [bacterium]
MPLFAALPADLRDQVATSGACRAVPAGQWICREGDEATSLYVVIVGTLCVSRAGPPAVELARLGEGEFFGEFSLFDGKPRSADVQAVTAATLFQLSQRAFLDLLASRHSATVFAKVLGVLVERVRSTTERAVEEEVRRRTAETEMEAERHRVAAELLAGLAHELNTPLGVARTGASILAARLAEPEVADALAGDAETALALEDMTEATALVDRSLQRAHRLVETLKRTSTAHLVDEREDVDLPSLVESVLQLVRVHSRDHRLEITVEDELPATDRRWSGHPGYLTQVLTNLLLNAERHAYPDGSGPATVRLAAEAGALILAESDAGAGMPAEVQSQIFTPFFTTARGRGGTGLGLAIVRNLVVDGLGGTIAVQSAVGAGTTFTIRLPREGDA